MSIFNKAKTLDSRKLPEPIKNVLTAFLISGAIGFSAGAKITEAANFLTGNKMSTIQKAISAFILGLAINAALLYGAVQQVQMNNKANNIKELNQYFDTLDNEKKIENLNNHFKFTQENFYSPEEVKNLGISNFDLKTEVIFEKLIEIYHDNRGNEALKNKIEDIFEEYSNQIPGHLQKEIENLNNTNNLSFLSN